MNFCILAILYSCSFAFCTFGALGAVLVVADVAASIDVDIESTNGSIISTPLAFFVYHHILSSKLIVCRSQL